MRFPAFILILGLLVGCASNGARPHAIWHPEVFSMIQCWLSDTASPVVTEVNLDAIQRDRNQFDQAAIKQEDGWIVYREARGSFKRYRVIEHNGNHYQVEYQENGGGTLTTVSQIEFSIGKRVIHVNGQPTVINILRVISYTR